MLTLSWFLDKLCIAGKCSGAGLVYWRLRYVVCGSNTSCVLGTGDRELAAAVYIVLPGILVRSGILGVFTWAAPLCGLHELPG